MAEGTPDPATDVREEASAPSTPESKSQKKKDKVRSAWISFVGRIVAQLVGAAATVSLGLYVVQRYQAPAAVQPAAAQPSSGAEARPAAHRTRSPRAAGVSLAVLPLDDYSGQADQAYFVDGLTEAIIADLARLDGLRVISRTSSMHYKGASRPLPEIAAELDVDLIVEGSVVRSGSRVRVTVQLIDAASDEHLWSRSYDRAAGDVLGLQAELAKAIAAEVDVAVAPLQAQRFAARGSVAPETYDLYLRGREAAGRRTADSLREAVGLFERAVARDPSFALGYAGLADAYSLMGASIYAQVDARTVMPLARSAAGWNIQSSPTTRVSPLLRASSPVPTKARLLCAAGSIALALRASWRSSSFAMQQAFCSALYRRRKFLREILSRRAKHCASHQLLSLAHLLPMTAPRAASNCAPRASRCCITRRRSRLPRTWAMSTCSTTATSGCAAGQWSTR